MKAAVVPSQLTLAARQSACELPSSQMFLKHWALEKISTASQPFQIVDELRYLLGGEFSRQLVQLLFKHLRVESRPDRRETARLDAD